uniref:Uncharacterized protein n=1 Tax=Kalanchoe fedtschenkoi TaxID=63787 RepID=A0A7N0ZYG5_KALFE
MLFAFFKKIVSRSSLPVLNGDGSGVTKNGSGECGERQGASGYGVNDGEWTGSTSRFQENFRTYCQRWCSYQKVSGHDILKRNKLTKDGKAALLFTPSEIKFGEQQHQYTLFVKFSTGKPRSEEIRAYLRQNYRTSGLVNTSGLDGRHDLIVMSSYEDVGEPWHHDLDSLGGVLDLTSRKSLSKIYVWIGISHLNIFYYNEGFQRLIGDEIEKYLKAHERKVSLARPAYARILIELAEKVQSDKTVEKTFEESANKLHRVDVADKPLEEEHKWRWGIPKCGNSVRGGVEVKA